MIKKKNTFLLLKLLALQIGMLGLISVVCLLLSGCSLSYILHAASGQLQLINNSIPMDDALNNNALSLEKKERLKLVAEIKDFGEKELGLKKTDNYQKVYLKPDRVPVYVVSAAPKDQLRNMTWWFPIVGKMPYLGYFKPEKAFDKKKDLVEKDYDVIVGQAKAYSTLGWFQDPVTLDLLEGTEVDLAETILHEMTHTTLYLNSQGSFNEGLANIVGKVGAIEFMEKKYGPTHPFTIEARYHREDNRVYSLFLKSVFDKLEECYNSHLSYQEKLDMREEIFDSALKLFDEKKSLFNSNSYMYFGKGEINNAYLLSIGLYNRYFNLFEDVLSLNNGSVNEMLKFLEDLSHKEGDMIGKMNKLLDSTEGISQ